MSLIGHNANSAVRSDPNSSTLQSSKPASADWPLVLLFAGFPLWWLLGLSSLLPLALAVPMLIQLRRRGNIQMPRGTGWWMLFLLWVLVGIFALWADAPNAVAGGGGPERLMVFAYRLAWYAACTVALLWVGNAGERDVPTLKVVRLLGWMFVITVAGGLLGMAAPRFEVTSLVEALLPASLSENSFVAEIVHPSAAHLTTFLGREEYRPIAPFAYANSWGSNLSVFLPFFLITWFGKKAGWRRLLAPVILLAAAFPVVQSMNRGLWACLVAGALILLVWLLIRRHTTALLLAGAAAIIAITAFALSPLADLSAERLDNAHSNDRRGALTSQTVSSVAEGSPILGFGSTRDVEGSFASIAGGATAACPSCAVPPLGTQGQLWLVVFSQGILGALFFLAFFASQLRAHWRCRTPLELAGVTLLLFGAIQMLIYDTLGMPLYTTMIAVGLMWRQSRNRGGTAVPAADGRPFAGLGGKYLPRLLTLTVTGALTGAAITTASPPAYSATASLLLAESPLYFSTDGNNASGSDGITIDTEAALVVSRQTLEHVDSRLNLNGVDQLRSNIDISAPRHTRVLDVRYTSSSPHQAGAVSNELAHAYLDVRGDYLAQRREQVLLSLREHLRDLEGSAQPVVAQTEGGVLPGPAAPVASTARVREAIDALALSPVSAGEVIRAAEPSKMRGQPEIPVVSGALIGFLLALTFARARLSLRGALNPRHRAAGAHLDTTEKSWISAIPRRREPLA